MLKYKIKMDDALERANFNTYKAKTSGLLSQDTLKKIKAESTDISLKALNNLCLILDMPPGAILDFEATDEEIERKKKL
ncbi:XRE family transcriptional regulator [Lachnospiraceae bacterium 48-42]